LETIADMMEFKGENPFKVGAFRNGALAIKRLDEDLQNIIAKKKLGEIKGIGKGLQAVVYEFFEKGESEVYNELKKEVPEGIEDLLKIRGLGAKKIRQLYETIGITNVGELEQACKENRLMLAKGFGEATQKKILEEIEKQKIYSKFVRLNVGCQFAEEIIKKLKKISAIRKIEFTGELRRGMEVISDIDLVALIGDENQFFIELKKTFTFETNLNKILLQEEYAVPVTLHIAKTEDEYAKETLLTTGSHYFISKLRLDEKSYGGITEEAIFSAAGKPYVIPEMREEEYFEAAEIFRKNSDLSVELFKGMLHFHTTYSDGRDSLRNMITSTKQFGYSYAAVCDHSKSAFYANGLNEDRIVKQTEEIKLLADELNFPVMQGIESDILQSGDLDYDSDFLANFDFVVASVHSRFSMIEDEMTKRIIKAVENEHTDVLGHPSGRLLLAREPYSFDVKKVIDACAANQVAIEINANPYRLDLDWRYVYYAREKNCLFSINQDAHSVEDINLLRYGISAGRKGGLQSEEVINCYELEKFKTFLQRKIKSRFTT
ncbi:MAG: PHP domain-containing protein, partial [Ignavibacteriaceae bacterium]|nr:PHP domain-containing protein [Ignavibacteriaceae bacterium]